MASRFAVLAIGELEPARIADAGCQMLGWQVREVDDAGVGIGPAIGSRRALPILGVQPVG
jgi:hypothetical protein